MTTRNAVFIISAVVIVLVYVKHAVSLRMSVSRSSTFVARTGYVAARSFRYDFGFVAAG